MLVAVALAAAAPAAAGAQPAATPPAADEPPAEVKALVQSCEAHKFETTIDLVVAGKAKKSKVKMCGTAGQSDADWIRTLKDAVDKTAANPKMPQSVKDQIIAAVNTEIARLAASTLQLPPGTDIAALPKRTARPPAPQAPIARD